MIENYGLDFLSDRYFGSHPVLNADGEPDTDTNERARADYRQTRDIMDAAPNDYAPIAKLRAAGFDSTRLLQLVEWTEARDTPSGMTSATPDDERGEIARRRRHGHTNCQPSISRNTTCAEAATAADKAGVLYLRIAYFGETHELTGATVKLARGMFLRSEHHGGYERGFDPADPESPAVCTQPERLKQTQLAGESVPEKACGRGAGSVACPDLGGCRRWQRLSNCGHAEFVGMTIDSAFDHFLPRELTGFDIAIIDEALDRAGYSESERSPTARLGSVLLSGSEPRPVSAAHAATTLARNAAAASLSVSSNSSGARR